MVDLTSGSTIAGGASAPGFSVASEVFDFRGPSSGCGGYSRKDIVSYSIILGQPKLVLRFPTSGYA